MVNIGAMRIATRLFALVVLSSFLWFFAGTPVRTQKTESKGSLPIQARQLAPVGGVLPIEIRCDDAKLSRPAKIDEASCTIKNNTFSSMVAGSVKVSFTLEQDGEVSVMSSYETFDQVLHPDFREDHKSNLIQPGMVYRLSIMPPNFGDGIVQKIEAEVDYIEFEDKTAVGPDHIGSQKINNIRAGAVKYKNWLARKYKEKGESASAISDLLEKDPDTLAGDIGVLNADQNSGASMYRNFARRTLQSDGPGGVTKHFKTN
jgi:hypothetical protein